MSKIEMVRTYHKDENCKENEDCLQQQSRWNQIKWKTKDKMVELCTSSLKVFGIKNCRELVMDREGWKKAIEEVKAHSGCNTKEEEE
ncbi:hypothetical protein L9F63_014644 [Diploptera punctata]|uniref:Uncharacterized protein n=1 Tax=Diploptera punctata TaxID=6984 RepID=A0AAD8A7I0_DIPPU|nr:hypothetical protein L9F63_014644 [Diploptera punctata]